MANQKENSGRGFASMDDDKQREIASEGGKASGGNFKNDPERASEAGKKGGEASHGSGRDSERSSGGSESGGRSSGGRSSGGSGSGGSGSGSGSENTRGGSREQHAEAGRQSHKND
jgi:general stress protein YciG